ncbi:MAG: (2Fe-2S)-binding protein [Proteobacteria bacterium]|nr:(2Fe-2S)-binding protein [Pseudomonadota bacterium]
MNVTANKPQTAAATTARGTGEVVEFQLDGRTVRALKGQNLVDALLEAGEPISAFCYHPGLSVAAQCRQCLVGIGDGYRLVPACQCTVQHGLSVRSQTDQVRDARRAMLELTLLNHPVDCVICDKAGECALQRHYMDWDARPAAINHEKVHKPKRVDLGPNVVLDAERCILCSRCVRFCTEVAQQQQLTMAQRGDHTVLTTAPGQQLDNPYALNTVDICPVGALTDKDFRFRSRVWELWSTLSVCNGCAAGCATEIHHKGHEIYRLVPPKRWDMNLSWMCDEGRRSYKAVGTERLTEAVVDGHPATPEQGCARAATALALLARRDPTSLAVVLGADATNEDNFMAAQLARHWVGARVFVADRADDGRGDTILRRDDPNPNRAGAQALTADQDATTTSREALLAALGAGAIKGLYVVGNASELAAPIAAALAATEFVLVQATHASALTRAAQVVLPAAAWPEVDGTITNERREVGRLRAAFEPPGQARAHWAWIAEIGAALGQPRQCASAKDVFEQLRDQVPLFRRASWGEERPTVRLRWACRRG